MADNKKKQSSKKFDPNKMLDAMFAAQKKNANNGPVPPRRPRIADAGSPFAFSLPMPYQPEFASPERVQWPIDRLQQNRYWRLFYKTDPVVSTVVDMFAEIIGTEFTMSGEGVEKEVKDCYEDMCDKTKIISLFPSFVREFLVMGEVIPHLVFDKKKGIWTSLMFHNPDQIKVIDSPFIALDPILEYTPDETIRALARSANPMIQELVNKLPANVRDSIVSGKNLPLNTALNATFLARKVHPYDVRGTSIFTRIYRILMYEDAVMNSSIATARRHAGPLKIAKLGDKELRWVPEQTYQDQIIQLLTVAEQDPHSFLILPWFVNFEAFGTTDKMMSVGREWDIIERIKLTALGVSQGFLHGEATYASMKGNMQTLLMRMAGLRAYFENSWWKPKFFRPIAEINEFIKPTPAEARHGLKFRRSKKELIEDNRYIIPDLNWKRSLDPKIDAELLDAFEQVMSRLKFPISKTSVYGAAGLDLEEEQMNMIREKKNEADLAKKMGVAPETLSGESEAKGGGGGGGAPPPVPEGEGEEEPVEMTPVEEAASKKSKKNKFSKAAQAQVKKDIGIDDDQFEDLVVLLQGSKKIPDSWGSILTASEKKVAEATGKAPIIGWERVEDFLYDEGLSNVQLQALRQRLLDEEFATPTRDEIVNKMIESVDPDSDEELNRVSEFIIRSNKKLKSQADAISKNATFFAGNGNKEYVVKKKK